jgi:hypothetical protein
MAEGKQHEEASMPITSYKTAIDDDDANTAALLGGSGRENSM